LKLDEAVIPDDQLIVWIGSVRVRACRQVEHREHALNKCPPGRENPRDNLGNLESARRFAREIFYMHGREVVRLQSAAVIGRDKTNNSAPDDPDVPKHCQPLGARTLKPFAAS
jgi:hypothetical protein